MSSPEDSNCQSDTMVALTIIHTIICAALSATTIYIMYKFIRNLKQEEITKTSIILSVAFCIVTVFTMLSQALYKAAKCYGIALLIKNILLLFYLICFTIQLYLVLFIFFKRLFYVFVNTSFRLSKCIQRTYFTFFLLFPLYAIVVFVSSILLATFSTLPT
eukprot:140659_1